MHFLVSKLCYHIQLAPLRFEDNPVKDLVSEMMILSGELVAKFGVEHNVPLPFRGQNPPKLPSDEKMAELPEGLCRQMALRSSMTRSNQGTTPRPHAALVGLYKLNPLHPELESAWFQPLSP
jgi:hypothetical protein